MQIKNPFTVHTGILTFCKSIRDIRTMRQGYVIYINELDTNKLFVKFIWCPNAPIRYTKAIVKCINKQTINSLILFTTKQDRKTILQLAIIGDSGGLQFYNY